MADAGVEELAVFSPLPPEQNGIADYTYNLLKPLSTSFDCRAFVADPFAEAPAGVRVCDERQAFRFIQPGQPVLHQIGNNPGHVFVLRALRNWGGITVLHDQNLHYLYELAGTEMPEMTAAMLAASPGAGAVFARHWREHGIKTMANYALFDMLSEVLSISAATIVHSHFARRRIAAIYGAVLAERVAVVPHLALPFAAEEPEILRAKLDLPDAAPLVVTSGFATHAKRFDWLVEALDVIVSRGIPFFWVHAGKERAEEFALSALLKRYPAVQKRCRITGYLSETDLNNYISACDILVNLRYPSVGESSGTLARAMSAGVCCIVNDTAAYSELPREAVVHLPVTNTIPCLADILEGLLNNPARRAEIGAAARHLALTEWAPETVAFRYAELLRQHRPSAVADISRPTTQPLQLRMELGLQTNRAMVEALIVGCKGQIKLDLLVRDFRLLAMISLSRPALLDFLLPPEFLLSSLRIDRNVATGDGSAMLRVQGLMQ